MKILVRDEYGFNYLNPSRIFNSSITFWNGKYQLKFTTAVACFIVFYKKFKSFEDGQKLLDDIETHEVLDDLMIYDVEAKCKELGIKLIGGDK